MGLGKMFGADIGAIVMYSKALKEHVKRRLKEGWVLIFAPDPIIEDIELNVYPPGTPYSVDHELIVLGAPPMLVPFLLARKTEGLRKYMVRRISETPIENPQYLPSDFSKRFKDIYVIFFLKKGVLLHVHVFERPRGKPVDEAVEEAVELLFKSVEESMEIAGRNR